MYHKNTMLDVYFAVSLLYLVVKANKYVTCSDKTENTSQAQVSDFTCTVPGINLANIPFRCIQPDRGVNNGFSYYFFNSMSLIN